MVLRNICHKLFCLQYGRPGFHPWVRKIPWRREWQPTPLFLPGESHGQRNLAGYSPRCLKRGEHNWGTKQQLHLSSDTFEHTQGRSPLCADSVGESSGTSQTLSHIRGPPCERSLLSTETVEDSLEINPLSASTLLRLPLWLSW